MRVTVNAATDGKPHSASPVSPVKVDLGRIKTSHAWTDRLRFSMLVALSLGLHVVLAMMLATQAKVTPIEEAIPVEVIVEQPAEAAAPDAPAPEEAPTEDIAQPIQEEPAIEEEPASDFARSSDQDREDGKASEQAAEETKPPPPQQEAAPEAPSDPAPVAKPALRFSGFEPLPDFQFKELPARRGEGPSGKADPGYLSTLYGLIMHKMPPLPKETRSARGRVTFGIQSNGRVFQETIAIPSGSPFLDAAALAAVRRSSPFPAPPKGTPVYMRFDYGSD
jgi:protein TonB